MSVNSKMHFSTLGNPEFINLQPLEINPLMSKCEIKVLYVGENRNQSFISEEVATEMAKTLRGAPIVGYYKDEKEDFSDHGDQIVIDGDGIQFNSLTRPYGFVSPDAQVWFQDFEERDDFGNSVQRKYLMTTGYLWDGQYEEAKVALSEGRPQSMELDEKTLDGHWATNSKSGLEFFIINDAIFSKLCILGEDVEPCFEGASVTVPDVSANFTLDNQFRKTLYSMMQELQSVLKEGGQQFMKKDQDLLNENDFEKNQEIIEEETSKTETDFSKTVNTESQVDYESEFKALSTRFDQLQENYNALSANYADLKTEKEELLAFKDQIEDKQKQDLIDSFYMLSEDDKKDVIQNKDKYSLDEIEAKLSVICVRNKVSFSAVKEEESYDKPNTTFTLENNVNETVPAWISALRETKNSKGI